MKSQLKVGTMILSIILASDKTHLTNFSGNKSMHVVYMSLGNIHKDIQRKLSAWTWLLVAKIPISKFPHTKFQCSKTEQKAMPRILHQHLFHIFMRIILSLTHLDTHKYHSPWPRWISSADNGNYDGMGCRSGGTTDNCWCT